MGVDGSVSVVGIDFIHHFEDPLGSIGCCPAVREVCEEVEGGNDVEPFGAGWVVSADA